MNNELIVKDGITLIDVANNPNAYPAELKAYSLETIKMLKSQLREIEIAISSNVINELVIDHATKLLFVGSDGTEKTLTLKSAPKKLNANIKNFEQYVIDNGFAHSQLCDIKCVPKSWSEMKELRKQGGAIQEVIDKIYIDGTPGIEIK
jgi:Cdc6-like AAA superfamily ATPase